MRQNSAVGVGSLALDSTLVRLGPPPVAVLVQPHPAQAQPSGKVLRHAPACRLRTVRLFAHYAART